MKILHSGTLDVKYGGPALSTYLTIKGLIENKVGAQMIMAPLPSGGELIAEDVKIHYTKPVLESRFGFMPHLHSDLRALGSYDLYHIQGLWLYLNHGVASFANKQKKPYVVTLRGMLYPQALAHSKYIKRLSLLLYQKRDLQNANCIQATCIDEMKYYRQLGFTNPVAVLPNPIDTSGLIEKPIEMKSKFRVGYLGRIHPRKRIERLIYAFNNLRNKLKDAELIIIGADNPDYEKFLKTEVTRMGLNNVKFTGFLTGAEKDRAISSLSILAVTSDFENFGNIVTEALVRGVPVIASKGTPWQELETYQCGWWINNDQESINKTILKAYEISEDERIQMGLNGKRLMKDNYSVEVLGKRMMTLYEWILGKADKPDFVYEN